MNRRNGVFDCIAPIYGLFYAYQKKHYGAVLEQVEKEVGLGLYKSIIDIGCGTGALCSVLSHKGFTVTGVEPAERMLEIAMNKPENQAIQFFQSDVLAGLPFGDKSFDVSIASYVAHGLKTDERKLMYAEMSRITKHLVIIYDYNDRRSPIADTIEWLEGGDYFCFIKQVKSEMHETFRDVRVIDVGKRAAWYVGLF